MDLRLKPSRPTLLKEEDRQYFQSFCSSPRDSLGGHGKDCFKCLCFVTVLRCCCSWFSQLGCSVFVLRWALRVSHIGDADTDVDWQQSHDQSLGRDASPSVEGRVGPWWSRLAPSSGAQSPATPGSPAHRSCITPSTSLCGGLPAQSPAALRVRFEASQMQEVLKDLLDAKRAVNGAADTPADLLLSMLSDMLLGRQPDLGDVALARSLLLRHADPYQPLNLRRQMREANLDADVVHALMHQLGASASADPRSSRAQSASGELTGTGGVGGGKGRTTGCPSRAGSVAAAFPEVAIAECEEAMLAAAAGNLRESLAVLLGLVSLSPESWPTEAAPESDSGRAGNTSGSGSEGEGGLRRRGRRMSVPLPMIDEVERVLALSDGWQYDTWQLAEVTQGHALSCLSFYLLHREGLISQFRVQPTKLARLLRTLEAGYPSNPYHNSTHAADVLQTLHVLLRGAGMTRHYLDRLGLMAAYFAAVVHDHGHPGLTADFLIATSDKLAVRYNDRSPLENHHGASFFELLQQPGMDTLAHLAPAEKAAFRKQVLDLVMATDMKQHFSVLAHFNTAHHLAPYNKDAGPWALSYSGRNRRSRSGAEAGDGEAAAEEAVGADDPRPMDETERTLSLQIALKAADLGHLGEDLDVHKRWVRSLEEEFFRQGDREQQLGLPISPLFDRTKQGVSKSQVGFYDFIALPLVHALAAAFPGARPLLACFVANYDHWRAVEKAAADKVQQQHPHPHPQLQQHSQKLLHPAPAPATDSEQ